MNVFCIYLRGELGKLKHDGDAALFLNRVSSDIRRRCGLPDSVPELTRRLNRQSAVDDFVSGLSNENLRDLAQSCSRDWRNNDVFRTLQDLSPWCEADVPVAAVRLQQAEKDRLGDLFRENGYELVRVASDRRILDSEPYCYCKPGEPVLFPTCLAKREGNIFRIFDGMHRAIQLVRNGSPSIHVCYSDVGAAKVRDP